MPEAIVKIWTHDSRLVEEFRADCECNGTSTPPWVTGTSVETRGALGGEEALTIVTIVVEFFAGVTAGLVANWLYDKLRNHKAKVTIDGRYVAREVTSGAVLESYFAEIGGRDGCAESGQKSAVSSTFTEDGGCHP